MTDDDKRRIERINEISKLGRSSWIGLLAYLAFIFVTLLGVEDADFFVPSRQTQLPLVGVEIPTKSFFFFAPVLGAALYVYLHLFLIKLWDAIGEAPATIRIPPTRNLGFVPEGPALPLSEVIHPWLVNDMATRWKKGAHPKRPLGWLSTLVTLVLVWVSGPAILGFFWWWSMPAHDEWLTLLTAMCLFLTVWTGATSWHRAREKLTGRVKGLVRRALRCLGALAVALLLFVGGWIRSEGGMEYWGVRTVQFVNLAFGREYLTWCDDLMSNHGLMQGPVRIYCRDAHEELWRNDILQERQVERRVITTEQFTFGEEDWPFRIWLEDGDDKTENTFSLLAETALGDVELVELPGNWRDHEIARREFREVWCRREALPMAVCDHLVEEDRPAPSHLAAVRETWCKDHPDPDGRDCGARFEEYDTRFVREWDVERKAHLANLPALDLSGADLRGADLARASLVNASLMGARMEGASLREARMEGANLWRARMEGASLREARMEGANLWLARMEGADLREARMERANLTGARMEGADLQEARMKGAALFGARMEGADLSKARMEGAVLFVARMQGAVLRDARMEGAVLFGARMQGAVLLGADLKSADWAGAILSSPAHSADLRGARNLSQEQLDQMIGDEWTLLPERNAPDTGEPYSIASCWEEAPPFYEAIWKGAIGNLSQLRFMAGLDPDFLCGDRPVVRYSTRLPVDAPYPEGHPLAERD